MKSHIKYFREDYDAVHLGQSVDDLHIELDKCEREMLDKFDKWRNNKKIKIISATPERYASVDVNDSQFVSLTVLYESE